MEIVFASIEDLHSTDKLQPAAIPPHAAVFVRIGQGVYALSEEDGKLAIRTQQQIIINPKVTNCILLSEQPY